MSELLGDQERRILAVLQQNAALPVAEIAERVGMSVSPCWRKIQALQKNGTIRGRVALIEPEKVGLRVTVFTQIKLTDHRRETIADFKREIDALPQVQECHLLIGDVDCMLKILVPDLDTYQEFYFDRLAPLPMVREVTSMMALSPLKQTTEVPL
ncbi:Lrp/AsnC family transcriptional regulator [Granulosicoccaceae sp. 1_MG-2023]|nr:Lrp/AsnC family transcriptional regulator [Granulosicoccaceae sp. 1_MG-2023]